MTKDTKLIKELIIRDFTTNIRGSSLGVLWVFLSPLLMMGLYTVVFGVLFKGSFDRETTETHLGYAMGIFLGLSVVNFINEIVTRSSTLIPFNENLVKRVAFPLEILPLVAVTSTLIKLIVNLLILIIILTITNSFTINVHYFYFPLVLLALIAIGFILSYFISAISVYIRDVQQIIPLITQIVFWTSGVFYSIDRVIAVPELWFFLRWNPLLHIVEQMRKILFWGEEVNFILISELTLLSIALSGVSYLIFHRLKKGFSDLI